MLPELAVTASGDAYIASQGRHSVLVQHINAAGQLVKKPVLLPNKEQLQLVQMVDVP